MFTQNLQRIGFACKYLHPDQTQKKKVLEEIQRTRTEKCTTVAWLNRLIGDTFGASRMYVSIVKKVLHE